MFKNCFGLYFFSLLVHACVHKVKGQLCSAESCGLSGHILLSLPALHICKHTLYLLTELRLCSVPRYLCVWHTFICVHMHVCKSLPPLWTIDVEGTFCCLFTVCHPSLFCLRQLHRNTEHRSALFFAFSSSVFFPLSSFLLFGCWIGVYSFLWGWLFRPSYVAVALGVPPHVQGHTERRRRPRCPTALMLPDSCIQEGRSEQEPVSLLCFYFWLCCEK